MKLRNLYIIVCRDLDDKQDHYISLAEVGRGWKLTTEFDRTCVLSKEWATLFMNHPALDQRYKLYRINDAKPVTQPTARKTKRQH